MMMALLYLLWLKLFAPNKMSALVHMLIYLSILKRIASIYLYLKGVNELEITCHLKTTYPPKISSF
jgi:hypothetical protein